MEFVLYASFKVNIEWILEFDDIRYGNNYLSFANTKCLLKIEFGLIQAPQSLKFYFIENVFNNKCKEELYSQKNISIFHCDKDLNIEKIKNLRFILKDLDYEFILTYNDLFIEKENEYIFAIVFEANKSKEDDIWIFGKPFMKNYQLVYDLDKKIIGLYKENINNKKRSLNYYIISLIVLISIVIILIIYIIYYIKKPRKHRAFELDEDVDYIPSN